MRKTLTGLALLVVATLATTFALARAASAANLSDPLSWVADRTDPQGFSVEGGVISFEVGEQPAADSWYAWQGRKAFTDAAPSDRWEVSYSLEVTEQMLKTDGVNQSLWIQVDRDGGNGAQSQQDCVDWAIVQFVNDGGRSRFQAWDSRGSGGWLDVSAEPSVGRHTVTTKFDGGTISQHLDGQLVNSYSVGETVTSPAALIAQGRSRGASFAVKMGVPVVTSTAARIDSDEALRAAIDSARDGDVIELDGDVNLLSPLTISKSVTLRGNGHAVTGQSTNGSVCLRVTAGRVEIDSMRFNGFADALGTGAQRAVIQVPESADAGTQLTVTGSSFSDFNRAAIDVRSGSLVMDDVSIDCANSSPEGRRLTKGVLVGLGANTVTARISGATVTNSSSAYADWSSAAVEVYNNAAVEIEGCKIERCATGLWVDDYWGNGDVSARLSGTEMTLTDTAICLYSTYEGEKAPGKVGGRASVAIEGGSYEGAIRIVGGTEDDTVTVSGGTWTADPSAYVSPGFAVSSLNGTYSVSAYEAGRAPVKIEASEGTADAVVESLGETGPDGSVAVEVPLVEGVTDALHDVSVSLPTHELPSVEELVVTTPVGTVSFDAAALEAIGEEAAGGIVTLRVTAQPDLLDAQREAVGNAPAYGLSLVSENGGEVGFSGGTATVSVGADVAPGQEVVVYHVDDDGSLDPRRTWLADNNVMFETGHFSVYMVASGHGETEVPDEEPGNEPPAAEGDGGTDEGEGTDGEVPDGEASEEEGPGEETPGAEQPEGEAPDTEQPEGEPQDGDSGHSPADVVTENNAHATSDLAADGHAEEGARLPETGDASAATSMAAVVGCGTLLVVAGALLARRAEG